MIKNIGAGKYLYFQKTSMVKCNLKIAVLNIICMTLRSPAIGFYEPFGFSSTNGLPSFQPIFTFDRYQDFPPSLFP